MATTKQKNVIDTPIDRRETFVSLSKSINDNDAAMEHKLHTLYLIQQKDSKIDEIHMLLGELPDEIRDLEDEIGEQQGCHRQVSGAAGQCQEQQGVCVHLP